MASSRSVRRVAAVLPVALALTVAGCASGSGTRTLPPALADARSAGSAPTPPASGSTGPSAAPTAPGRTSADLQGALLSLHDLPDGFFVASEGNEAPATITSSEPGCAPLVALLNEEHPHGSTGRATIDFGADASGPFFGESLIAFSDRTRAQAAVRDIRDAARACQSLSIDLDGKGSKPFEVVEHSSPDLGEDHTSVRLISTDPGTDLELDLSFIAVDTVLLGTTGVGARPEDLDSFTQNAYDKLVGRTPSGSGNGGGSGGGSGGVGKGQPA